MSFRWISWNPRRCIAAVAAWLLCGFAALGAARAQDLPPLPEGSRFTRPAEREITFQEGLLQYQRGDFAAAQRNFQKLVEADAADSEAWYYLGLTQLDSGRPGEAARSFDQSLRLDPTPYEVRAARATALIRLRQFDRAEEDIDLLAQEPRWSGMASYLRGQMYYAQGKLEEASKEFAAAKRSGQTEASPAELYEGLTYIRMRELVRARQTFREAGLGADRDPAVAAASRQIDAVLSAQQRRPKPWEAQISLGWEWDSNVILIGSDIALPQDISSEEDWRFVLQPRGSYSLIEQGKWDIGVEGSGFFRFHDSLTEFDIASYQAGPFANYRIGKNLYASARYGFNYLELDYEDYLYRHLATPQLTWVQPKFGYTSVYYQFEKRDFPDASSTPELDRDGETHAVGVVQGIRLPRIFDTVNPPNVDVSYRFEDVNTDGDDFDGTFHVVGATLYVPLPFWRIRADAGVHARFDEYENPNSLDSDGDERSDTQLGFNAGLTKVISEHMSVRVDYSYTDRNSNVEFSPGVEPYDYDRQQVGVRLIFSY